MSVIKSLKKVAVVAGFGMVGMMGSDSAQAAGTLQDSQTFGVTVTVAANCTMAVGGTANLGAYDYALGATGSTSVDVTCSLGAPYELHFDNGTRGDNTLLRVGGTVGTAGDQMTYTMDNLVGAGGTNLSGAIVSGNGAGLATPITLPVEVNLAGSQAPADGTFNDTVTVDLYY